MIAHFLKINIHRSKINGYLIPIGPYLISFLAISSLPWIFQYLPLLDYPDWLAQGYIVQKLLAQNQQFGIIWSISTIPTPNILIPILLGLLSSIMSIENAGKILLSLYLFSFPLLVLTLGKKLSTKGMSASFILCVWVFNSFFYYGYIGYLISLLLAWLSFLFLDHYTEHYHLSTIIIYAVLSFLTYLAHLMGYLCLFLVTISFVITQWVAGRKTLNTFLPVLVQVFPIFALILYSVSKIGSGQLDISIYQSLGNKLASFFEPFFVTFRMSPVYEFPFCSIVNFLVGFFVLGSLFLKRKTVAFSHFTLAGIFLIILGIVLPFSWFGGMERPDERLLFPGVLLFLSSVSLNSVISIAPTHPPVSRPRKLEFTAVILLLMIFLINVLQFSQIQEPFIGIVNTTDKFIEENKSIEIIALMNSSWINHSCENRWGNIGSLGDLAIIRAPYYSFLKTKKAYKISLFSTSVLRENKILPGFVYNNIVLSAPDYIKNADDTTIFQNLTISKDNSAIIFGCPEELRQLDSLINPLLHQVNSGIGFPFARIFTGGENEPLFRATR
jgi:hypothetical protein